MSDLASSSTNVPLGRAKPLDSIKPASPPPSPEPSAVSPPAKAGPTTGGPAAAGSPASGKTGVPDVKADKVVASEHGAHIKQPWYRQRRFIIAGIVAVLVLAGGAALAFKMMDHPKTAAVMATPKPSPSPSATPVVYYSPLTGLPVSSVSATQQPVIGVMIENLYPNARPQSGLGQAGVVYEALAEGGITRFLAIFQEPLPPTIGPVRSLRPYYLDWGLEYNIPVAHAGGSQPALAEVGPLGLKDINALKFDGSSFYRTTDRVAPHNLYTNAQLLAQLDAKLGFATPPTFTPVARKADAPASPPTHTSIKINFSTSPYAVAYTFNAGADDYLRAMGGTPHIDRNTGQQIQVKNIVVEFVPTTYSTQDDGKPETNYKLVASGQALIFEDGGVTPATWSKASDPDPTKIVNATTGQPITLNRGNTWYEIVPTGTSVTY